eukprot:TRINITY_DN16808_c0_g1_i1.p2 TRINITY_DN16808_c0_g1~~TRINITY_DN16808_c0_g1_i1.p2  ORF type:complete len:328 (+),score=41.37 TRINITY_DN16808_c0_g1_i1:646-1629(+)
MNSYLQCLFFTHQFKESILNCKIEIQHLTDKNTEIFLELQELFSKMHKAEQHSVKPDKLKKVCPEPFRSSHIEQDASEFGKFFLEALEAQIKHIDHLKNLVQNCFFGSIKSKIICPKCSHISENNEIISDITVSFQQQELVQDPNYLQSYNLLQFLSQSSIQENIYDSSFKCSSCDTQSSSFSKITQISKLPPYLIININRFLFNAQQQIREKLMNQVIVNEQFHIKQVFPTLEIEETDQSGIYYLYAVIIHVGTRIDHGHYYSFLRESNQDDWYQLNDTKVKKLGQLDLNNLSKYDTPYVLFCANSQEKSIDLYYDNEQIPQENTD